ncbi:MAG TPA: hypothetical protein VLY46_02945, partial [Usitatibacter sp.]|nr:hypothetical protein [Usitatibacter sp.]
LVALALIVTGLGTGIFGSPNNNTLMGAAPRHRQGIAGGVLACARNTGMVLGVGLAAAVFTTVLGSAPVGGPVPPGMTSFASVDIGRLAPGAYHAEAWGTPDTGGDAQSYFTLDFQVSAESNVTEYYAVSLDHYFMSASGDEVDLLDAGGEGGWQRTGQSFHAWLHAEDAPAGAQPVCRFYAAGPNSHFYTASADECAGLRSLEQAQRAQAAAIGQPFLGWGYEGIAFYALVPANGQCPSGTSPVWRSYNDRAAEDDSNHRFTVDPLQHLAMQGWVDEGPVFCSPQ